MTIDRGQITKGMFIKGSPCRVEYLALEDDQALVTRAQGPVVYGTPIPKRPKRPSFAEIEERLARLKRKLDELAQAARRGR